jgi:hypothetical protein
MDTQMNQLNLAGTVGANAAIGMAFLDDDDDELPPPPPQTIIGSSTSTQLGPSSSTIGIPYTTTGDSSTSSTSMGHHQSATGNFQFIPSGPMQTAQTLETTEPNGNQTQNVPPPTKTDSSQQQQMPAAITNIQLRQKVYIHIHIINQLYFKKNWLL